MIGICLCILDMCVLSRHLINGPTARKFNMKMTVKLGLCAYEILKNT